MAVALVLPLGRGLIDAWLFDRAGDRVSEELAGDELDEALAAAVLLVRTTSCAGGASSGSAFSAEVDGQTVVLTNRHVVEGASVVGLRTLTGGAGPRVRAWRLASGADVAVLLLEDPTQQPPPLTVAEDLVGVGTEIRTVGFPSAMPFTTTGTVTEIARERLVLEVRTEPGASGSPVIAGGGQVVGQIFARWTEPGASGSPVIAGGGQVVGQIFARSDRGAGVATSAPALRAALDRLTPERDGCS